MADVLAGKTIRDEALEKAERLAEWLRSDAAERDKQGGTPTAQRDALRSSGLLKLLIPKVYGGDGSKWSLVLEVTRILAAADPSLAHLYGYHFLCLVAPHLAGSEEQRGHFYRSTAANNWFWGNSSNPLDRGIIGIRNGSRVIVDGAKSFSSGSPDSDILAISWHDSETGDYYEGIVPTSREGITVVDDWDAFGQRQTGSGTVRFHQVVVEENEILHTPYAGHTVFSTLIPILSQSILGSLFAGISEGIIAEARQYTLRDARPWYKSGVERASEETSTLRRYGELWTEHQAALSLLEKAALRLDDVWDKGTALTEEERGECAVLTAAANVKAGETALLLSSRIFEVMGARSTASRFGYDRFWRNARVHTLHNPVEFKLRTVGDWVLNGKGPAPGFYS
ncbi:acyl-CoA dehydrogenase family protein [Paenibacillus sp. CAU 1782]